ncbi:Phosphatase dcr2 [Lodderomyces elongisporus]|uniref:Phosphatase dcr2 n=1 Tax=Lodderomyces elongisporus TaxID=36914 RepID=UPI00291F3C64|nr:Phosphatase dcr2 [Lodderomyces elongisporus]WLF77514.1 Phosphatase dcr2 [Lodderomyces elongisporus]
MLPKRFLRGFLYLFVFLGVATTLLLIANKHQIIEINEYIPFDYFSSAAPSFFQPPSNSFIIDIAIRECYIVNYKNPNCGKPEPSAGKFGDLSSYGSSWVRVKKDLGLGKLWFHKKILSLKKLEHKEFQNLIRENIIDDTVVIDIVVGDAKADANIPGNVHRLPQKIIDKFNKDKDVENLKYDAKLQSEFKQDEGKIIENEITEKYNEEDPKKEDGKNTQNDQNKPKLKEVKGTNVDENGKRKRERKTKRNDDKSHNFDTSGVMNQLDIPTMEQVKEQGWVYKFNGVWIQYGSHNNEQAINGIDLLFGPEAVDPRPNWELIQQPIQDISISTELAPHLTFRRGPKLDYKKKYNTPLKINGDQFKILQVADLHFSTGYGKCLEPQPPSSAIGCKADSRTLKFINHVLDVEKPDMVVLTGDQVFGSTSPDSETSAFKALSPYIERKIPFAIVMGNHDAEGSLGAKEMMGLYANMPYSVAAMGPEEIDGFGNYVVSVQGKTSTSVALSFYFVDSHAYSSNPKVYPGYDWIKPNQLMYMKEEGAALRDGIAEFEKETVKEVDQETKKEKKKNRTHLSMAFFHIPIPEFKNFNQPMTGEHREGVTAPRYNTGARDVFQELGVKAIGIGHDHCNDYCLMDQKQSQLQSRQEKREGDSGDAGDAGDNKIWLCYGGGVGLGGYGGYGGYIRRLRVFALDTAKGEIKTWKRTEAEPEKIIDEQILVTGGNVVNW